VRHAAARGLPEPSLANFTLYADTVSRGMYPDEDQAAQRDAARHMIASALASRRLSPGVAELLGRLYEFKEAPLRTAGHWLGLGRPRADYPTDTHNNALGAELGGRRGLSTDELLRAIQQAVDSGTIELTPGRPSLRPDTDTRYDAKARGGLAQAKECNCHG
jgi:hypothetical protein